VTLEATVSPSEDREKVLAAVGNVTGGAPGESSEAGESVKISFDEIRCLDRLKDQLRDRRVRSATRRLLLASRSGDTVTLMLNRQAASVGIIAVCGGPDESPLGPIYLTIRSPKIIEVIDWLTGYESE
jgi:predicted RNA binding protein with dsRBD fold (UPF0201 family)